MKKRANTAVFICILVACMDLLLFNVGRNFGRPWARTRSAEPDSLVLKWQHRAAKRAAKLQADDNWKRAGGAWLEAYCIARIFGGPSHAVAGHAVHDLAAAQRCYAAAGPRYQAAMRWFVSRGM